MPAWQVASVVAPANQRLSLTRPQQLHLDGRAVKANRSRIRSKQHRISSGQRLRPTVCMLGFLLLQLCKRLSWSAARRHSGEAPSHRKSRDDVAVLAPACTVKHRCVTQLYRRASLQRNPFQFAVRKEPDKLTVGREKWTVSVFGPGERGSLLLLELPYVQPNLPVLPATRVHDAHPVW